MAFDITIHGVAGTAKGEETHGGCNTDINPHHGGGYFVFEFTGIISTAGINRGGIGEIP